MNNFAIYLDSRMLRTPLLAQHVLSNNVQRFPIFLSYLNLLEWSGFTWVEFFNEKDIGSRITDTWKWLSDLPFGEEGVASQGLECIERFRSHLVEEISNEFESRFFERFEKQLTYTEEPLRGILRDELSKISDDSSLELEARERIIGTPLLQAFFAPETIDFEPQEMVSSRMKQVRKLWSQQFLLASCFSHKIQGEHVPICSLWPLYVSIEDRKLKRGQLVDIEFLDSLFFGIGERHLIVYTAESYKKQRNLTDHLMKVFLRCLADLRRNCCPEKVDNFSFRWGSIVCIDSDGTEVSSRTIEVSEIFSTVWSNYSSNLSFE